MKEKRKVVIRLWLSLTTRNAMLFCIQVEYVHTFQSIAGGTECHAILQTSSTFSTDRLTDLENNLPLFYFILLCIVVNVYLSYQVENHITRSGLVQNALYVTRRELETKKKPTRRTRTISALFSIHRKLTLFLPQFNILHFSLSNIIISIELSYSIHAQLTLLYLPNITIPT